MRSLVFYLLIGFFLVGCNVKPDTCKEQSAWQMRIGFKKISYLRLTANDSIKVVKDSTVRSFIARFVTFFDTTVFQAPSLPLAQTRDTSVFLFNMNGKGIDSLIVIYKRNHIFENYKCGFRTDFVLDKIYTSPVIYDSIVIVQPNITDVYQENCRIYLNNDSTKYH